MFKKTTLGVVGLLVLGGLLFGGKVIPYAQTAFQKVKSTANDSVPVEFQITAAENQLAKIGPEIHSMVQKIAKEKVQVKKLAAQLENQNELLDQQKEEMLTLREHVGSGEKFYVATNGKAYTSERVKEDLKHRFKVYRTAEATQEKLTTIVEIRRTSLEAALTSVDEAKSQQRELEVQLEDLKARNRMNEVVNTANKFNVDNSQLTQTRQMVEDIDARLAAEEEMMNLMPAYTTGQIPVSADQYAGETDILDDMDAYFNKKSKSDDANNVDDDDLVFSN